MSAVDRLGKRRPGVEMSADPRFAQRVLRLALTSVVALGFIWLLSATTVKAHVAISIALAGGWVLMPLTLGLSLRWPALRYALLVPSSLISLALLAICISALPEGQITGVGWLLITAGVLFGGVLGVWFWFRWIPVPAQLDDPFSTGRWVLVGTHVILTAAGLVIVSGSVLM